MAKLGGAAFVLFGLASALGLSEVAGFVETAFRFR
jgi:hypothetical protein